MLPRSSSKMLFLAPLLLSWILSFVLVLAVPIPVKPIDHTTQYAATADENHVHHFNQFRNTPEHSRAKPGSVSAPHAVPGQEGAPHVQGHFMGTIGVDAVHQHQAMSAADLHAHAKKVQVALKDSGHGIHDVRVHHTPGNAHAMYYASPRGSTSGAHGTVHTAVHPGDSSAIPAGANPSVHHTRQAINTGLTAQVAQAGQQALLTVVPGANGQAAYSHGRIPVADPYLTTRMGTPGALEGHAHFIRERISPSPNVHVHATHTNGDDHIDYHIVPAQTTVTHNAIRSFLRDRGDAHYPSDKSQSLTVDRHLHPDAVGDHKYTWHGKMPAHTTAKMTPEELKIYAEHAHDKIIKLNKLQGVDADKMVTAAIHKEGDTEVHFHTQPKKGMMIRRGKGEFADKTPDPLAQRLNVALEQEGHKKEVTTASGETMNIPWHHAELGALYDSVRSKAAQPEYRGQSIDNTIQGHVVGVWAPRDDVNHKVCNKCQRTLNRLGVEHHGSPQ